MLLGIVAKPSRRDKFEVTHESVAYLTGLLITIKKLVEKIKFLFFLALVSVSEEVRSRCHVKHTIPRWQTESTNEQAQETGNAQSVRRQKSWDMLDQSAISYARQQQHKAPHQVIIRLLFMKKKSLSYYKVYELSFFSINLMDVVY